MLVLVALGILLVSITCGYVLWVKPLEATLEVKAKACLLFILLTFFGALWGFAPWWLDDESSFAWNLPPLASRMLGAAALAFVVGGLFTLFRPTHARLRVMLLMIGAYMLPLAVAIIAFHLDRFDFGEPVVWGFFPLVVIMCTAVVYFLAETPLVVVDSAVLDAGIHPVVRIWLLSVGVLTLVWGLALFVTDDGFSSEIWAWPGDLLSSRLIAVMLLTLAAVAFGTMYYKAATTMTLAVIAIYGLAGAVANLWQEFLDKPVKQDYVIALGVVGIVSAALLLWQEWQHREVGKIRLDVQAAPSEP